MVVSASLTMSSFILVVMGSSQFDDGAVDHRAQTRKLAADARLRPATTAPAPPQPSIQNRQGSLHTRNYNMGEPLQEHGDVAPIASVHAARRISMHRRNALNSACE